MKGLENLKVFLSVARLRSFSKAAAKLQIPKSTVSRRIKELEMLLKIQLINRDQRNFELTNAGDVLFTKGEAAWGEVERIFDEVRSDGNSLLGQIIISTTADLAKAFLCAPLAEFLTEHPKLKIDIDVTPVQVDLISDRVDIAIRVGPLNNSSLFAKKLCERTIGFFASPEFLKKNGRLQNEADLFQKPIISVSRRRIGEQTLDPTIKVNNMGVILNLVLAGAGVGILDIEFMSELVKEGKIVHVLKETKLEKVPIYLVYQQRNPIRKVRLLMDKLIAENK